jgi:recombinational DNA repair protein RecT
MAKKTVISRALKHYVDGLSAAVEEAYKAISRQTEREEIENKPLTSPPDAPGTSGDSSEYDKPF